MSAHDKYSDELVLFKDTICEKCGLCGEVVSPDFCSLLYDSGTKRFLQQALSVVMAARMTSKGIDALRCFDGFCFLFCEDCPLVVGKKKCDLSSQLDCYSFFLMQSKRTLDDSARGLIVKSHKGRNKQLENALAPTNFSKKDKKQIKKTIKSARTAFELGQRTITQKPRQPVHTTCFWDTNDKQWDTFIKECLAI